MKKLLFNSLLFLLSFQVFSQGEADNWVLYGNTQLTFDEDKIKTSQIKDYNN